MLRGNKCNKLIEQSYTTYKSTGFFITYKDKFLSYGDFGFIETNISSATFFPQLEAIKKYVMPNLEKDGLTKLESGVIKRKKVNMEDIKIVEATYTQQYTIKEHI